jgi:hypothetical protein
VGCKSSAVREKSFSGINSVTVGVVGMGSKDCQLQRVVELLDRSIFGGLDGGDNVTSEAGRVSREE